MVKETKVEKKWLIRSREIPKNGSGNRNWGNPKDVNEQLYKTLVETAYL